MKIQLKRLKQFLKTSPLTRRPVWYALNSRTRFKWRWFRHRQALAYPRVINIETTNYCNEKCWFCPRADATRGFGLVSMDLVKKIVDQGVPHGGIVYYLHKDGEPLMHPKVLDIVRYIKEAHPKNEVRLTTNGVLLKEKIARGLIELNTDHVRVGIRAATRETFKQIHKQDHFDRVKANIERILRLKEEVGAKSPLIVVQLVVCQDTAGEVELFREQWGDKDVYVEIKDFMSWGGWTADPTLGSTANNDNDPRRPPCIDPFHNLVVNWDGKVSLCSLDWNAAVPLGHVAKQDVLEVWKGEPVKAVREAHLNGNYKQNSMCANCQEWRYVPNLFWKNRLVFWKDQRWL